MIARTRDPVGLGVPVSPASQSVSEAALKDAMPVIAGLAPLGLGIGAAIADAHISSVTGWLSSPFIYGASPQLAAVSMLGAGAAGISIIATIAVLNARALFYSARLQAAFRTQ